MALSRKQLHIILTEVQVINFHRPGGRRRFREVDASGIEWRSIDPSPSLFRLEPRLDSDGLMQCPQTLTLFLTHGGSSFNDETTHWQTARDPP